MLDLTTILVVGIVGGIIVYVVFPLFMLFIGSKIIKKVIGK